MQTTPGERHKHSAGEATFSEKVGLPGQVSPPVFKDFSWCACNYDRPSSAISKMDKKVAP